MSEQQRSPEWEAVQMLQVIAGQLQRVAEDQAATRRWVTFIGWCFILWLAVGALWFLALLAAFG